LTTTARACVPCNVNTNKATNRLRKEQWNGTSAEQSAGGGNYN